MKKIIFTFLFFFTIMMFGQTNNQFGTINDQVSFLSPQAYEFIQHGKTPVSLFTGQTNLQIPIYTYKDNDFQIPISLGYNSSGFIPNKREGIVGLNWFLNSGGMITRKVNGFPDDKGGQPTNIPTTLHGLYYGIKNNLLVKQKTKDCIFNFNSGCGEVTLTEYWNINGCEVDPDEFNFSMPGFSGKFFIQNNGEIKCEGSKPFIVNLDSFSTQPYSSGYNINDSMIKIITDDGYEYQFGGNIQYLEVSYNIDKIGTSFNPKDPIINAWHLNKIIAPNGREIVYTYKTFEEGFSPHYPIDSNHYLLNIYDYDYATAISDCNDFAGGMCSYIGGSGGLIHEDNNATKTVYLEKIAIEDTTIKFDYVENENLFYQEAENINHGFNQKTLRLDKINIYYKNITPPIKSFTFGYQYKGPLEAKRLFLTELIENGKTPYTFDYYKTTNLPKPTTHGIDYWGYWNGKPYNNNLLPAINYQQNGDTEYVGNEREPDANYCDVGLLQFIHYPTGGSTEYIYEAHDYSKRLERRNSSNFKPQLFSVSGYAGGARIKKIIDNDGTNDTNIREFIYKKDYLTTNNSSSGILLSWPRMLFYWEYNDGYTVQKMMQKKSESYNYSINPGEGHIQYSEVVEKNDLDGSFTINKFTNYETNPNDDNHNIFIVDSPYYSYVNNLDLYLSYVDRGFNNRSFERGYPYEIQKYLIQPDLTKKLVYEKNIDYTSFNNNTNNYVVGVYQTGSIAKSYKDYYYPYLPLKETEKIYSTDSNNFTSKVVDYSYDTNGYLIEKKLINSENKSIRTSFEYPYNSSVSGANLLVQKNILNIPVKTENYNELTKLSETDTEFFTYNGNVVPSITKYGKGEITVSNPLNTKEIYHNYDSNGNLLEVSKTDGTHIVYIWGYNKTQPIAKIENASYADISTATITNLQDKSDLDIDDTSEQALRVSLNNLRAQLHNSMVTTYTYDPLIGITSKTSPRGETIYYKYDSSNRLVFIIDQDSNIIQSFCYNYQGQVENCEKITEYKNIEKTGTFTKNNCTVGTGTDVIYTVPSGAYFSTISQIDADTKAQYDVDSNGQTYANENGACDVLPSSPTGLVSNGSSTTSIYFSWNAVTGADGYKIYKDGVYVKSTTATSGFLSGLAPSTSYSVQVLAYNAAGNSALCPSVSMTTSAATYTNRGSIINNTGHTIGASTIIIKANGSTMVSVSMPSLANGATFDFSTGYSSPISSNGTFILQMYNSTVGIAPNNYFNMMNGSTSTNGYFSYQGWGYQATVTSTGPQYALVLNIH